MSGIPLKNLFSLTEPFGPPSPLRAVVRHEDDDRVVELAGLLEVVEQAPDVVVGVREEAGVHLGHPGEQRLLVGRQRVPGPRHVDRVPGLAVVALLVDVRVGGDSSASSGMIPIFFWRSNTISRYLSYPMSNLPLYLSIHSFGAWCGAWRRARAEVHEEGLLGRDHLRVADELDRLVGQVLGQVVALLAASRRLAAPRWLS